jgi:hypothetical protein
MLLAVCERRNTSGLPRAMPWAMLFVAFGEKCPQSLCVPCVLCDKFSYAPATARGTDCRRKSGSTVMGGSPPGFRLRLHPGLLSVAPLERATTRQTQILSPLKRLMDVGVPFSRGFACGSTPGYYLSPLQGEG